MMSSGHKRVHSLGSVPVPTISQLQVGYSGQQDYTANDMNSIYSAVIKVFRGEGLQMNELYSLNERIRWLLKTEMGSFIKEYFQNQLLNKGLGFILEDLQQHHRESRLFVLAEVWLLFFSEILPSLQAIFYPLQGQELTVRQMALLAFRDLVLMQLPLEELLPNNSSLLPSAITQMLLILQGVHEPRGPSEEYCRLEKVLETVVSPYLWNCKHQSSAEETRDSSLLIRPEIRITQHTSESSLLSPLQEQEGEAYLDRGAGLWRHTVAKGLSTISNRSKLLSITDGMQTFEEIKEHHSRDNYLESQSC
ncbi:proline-rich protein 5-like isoform X1 [Astyanax mexicanus]|uniref:Proline-rich protein 5-like isoform X1 n=1 Tax=Astyanax mexicanus TaxID=7994 RepID=A0A8T2KMB1_ASTMX|nr:proline-rich protein 5-like isoform X1 [Astyanax mexicanus]